LLLRCCEGSKNQFWSAASHFYLIDCLSKGIHHILLLTGLQDFGEDSEALNVVQQHIKAN
jgi:hypothetical protein